MTIELRNSLGLWYVAHLDEWKRQSQAGWVWYGKHVPQQYIKSCSNASLELQSRLIWKMLPLHWQWACVVQASSSLTCKLKPFPFEMRKEILDTKAWEFSRWAMSHFTEQQAKGKRVPAWKSNKCRERVSACDLPLRNTYFALSLLSATQSEAKPSQFQSLRLELINYL